MMQAQFSMPVYESQIEHYRRQEFLKTGLGEKYFYAYKTPDVKAQVWMRYQFEKVLKQKEQGLDKP